jgi:hypothetical protein
MDLGPNLAIALVDISEVGARLMVKTPLEKGQTVVITLEGREHVRPIKLLASVNRSEQDADGVWQLAVLWEKRLTFAEIAKIT